MVTSIDRQEAKVALKPGWCMVRFGDVVRNVDINERDPLAKGLERYIGLDHIDPESLHIRRWGLIEEGTTFTRTFVKGQTLFGKRRAYQRKVAVAEFAGICSGDILVFEARDGLLPELLPFIVQSDPFYEYAVNTSAGSLSPRTKWKDLAAYEFALPPKDEQRRIADILWAADEVYRKNEKMFLLCCSSRQTIVDQVISELVATQSSSEKVPLKSICKMQNGRSFSSEQYCNEGIRLLRPGNLDKGGYITWNSDNTKHLPCDYRTVASEYLINPGDIVINLTAQSLEEGFMGRVCMAGINDFSLLNQRIGRFICNECILPEYLYRYLQTAPFRNLVESSCEGSKIKHLYWRHIENFPILLPPIKQQQRIIQILAAVDVSQARAEENQLNAQALCKCLREELLSPI